MTWLRDRLTARRRILVAAVLALGGVLVVLGDPLAHPNEGAQPDGARGLVGVPRVVELTALAVALILAAPPRGDDEPDREDDA